MFYNINELKSINITYTVRSIGDEAFRGGSAFSYTVVNLAPNAVSRLEVIGADAFNGNAGMGRISTALNRHLLRRYD